jgi:hypothetical protein
MAITNFYRAAVLLALTLVVTPATGRGDFITDPVGDFLPTYLGPKNGDLDVVGAEVGFNGTNFLLHVVMNAPVGTTTGAVYVFGFNRGAGTVGFPTLAPGVRFDGVIVLDNNDTSPTAGVTVTHSANEIFASVPASLPAMASTGFAQANYTWDVWPRNPVFGGLASITDFAPDNSNASVTPVPAPPAFLLGAVGAMGLLGRRALSRKVEK